MQSEGPSRPRGDWMKRVVMLLILLGAGAATLITLQPRAGVASDSGFDNAAALRHLEFIADAPRPVGSAHHRAVREYLVEQFGRLGLEVQVQETRVGSRRYLRGLPIEVSNVVARLRGRGDAATRPTTISASGAVMLAAHYDSTRQNRAESRGAADDGAAVAALLEVARLLAADPPRNDVIVLITDAEELGLHGAEAFVAEHPWARDVGVVLNFEARGTSGPSIMFQTSRGDAHLVREYARVAPHPATSSISELVYRYMPNNTDFTVFRDAGMPGMNFAFIGDYANYHTAGDTIENLHVGSMRHHGVQALALARRFGEMDLGELRAGTDAVYFNLFSLGVVRYPARWATLIATVAAAACALAVLVAAQRGEASLRGVVWGAALLVMNVLATAGLAWLLVERLPARALAQNVSLSIGGFALMSLAVTAALVGLFERYDRGRGSFLVAALVLWMILSILSAGYAPGASYLAAWPTLCGAAGLLVARPDRRITWPRAVALALLALPAVVLLTPVTYLAFLGFRLRLAAAVVPLIVLALWLLLPNVRLLAPRGWVVPLLAACGSAACFVVALR